MTSNEQPTVEFPGDDPEPSTSDTPRHAVTQVEEVRVEDARTDEPRVAEPPAAPRWTPPELTAYEPPPGRRFDPARGLRTLAGVDERLLRQVWFERARHTALGGIILGTGLIAGFSMWMAINESLGHASALYLIPALIWFVFIVSLDRVLVSTMIGAGRRWGPFLMRLALAMMFGFIIAEPITIRIFQTAIEQHIQDERAQQLDDLRSKLLTCNTRETVTGAATPRAGCETYLLSFGTSPVAAQAELAARRQDEVALKATVDADNKELARLTEMARKECAGTSGPGLTGQQGYGPDCRDRNRDVATFKATHPIKSNTQRLTAVRTQVATLEAELGDAQSNFEQTRDAQITQRVAEARAHQGAIGFLERMAALHALAASSLALLIGTWAVRLFFVAVDCLPVVAKFSGGSSEYDKVFRAQSMSSVERHSRELEMLRDEAETYRRKRKAELDLELQEHRAGLRMRLGHAVSRVADQLLRPRC